MKVILFSIDVHKFNSFAQQQSNSETKNFLIGYYKHIENELPNDTWSVVKTIGDCVLLKCAAVLTPEQELVIKDLYWRISKKYTVAFNYRECEIELAAISIASYYCNDVFGKDVCNLFLKDENTFSLG